MWKIAFKKFEGLCSAKADHITTWKFLKAVFHKFYLVHSWILCPIVRTPSNIHEGSFWKNSYKSIYLQKSFIIDVWLGKLSENALLWNLQKNVLYKETQLIRGHQYIQKILQNLLRHELFLFFYFYSSLFYFW